MFIGCIFYEMLISVCPRKNVHVSEIYARQSAFVNIISVILALMN